MKIPTALVFFAAAFLSSAKGALLVTYSFTGAAANSTGPFAAESSAAGLSASSLTGTNMGTGSPATGGVVTGFFSPTDGSPSAYNFDNAGYEVAAITMADDLSGVISPASSYFAFSITPTTGNAILYTSLSLDFGWDFTVDPSSTRVGYDLYYSLNGTTYTQIGARSERVPTASVINHAVYNDVTKDIAATDGFAAPLDGTVYFQLRFADTNSGSADKHLFIDDIKLNGTISAIPEPTSSVLLISSSLMLFRRRRC